MKSIGIVWAQFGPYHFARAAALQRLVGTDRACALEIANRTSVYAWQRTALEVNLITLCPNAVFEETSLAAVFLSARRELAKARIKVCLITGYYPPQLFAVLLAAKSLGIKTVMMNEGHGGVAKIHGPVAWVKRRLVGLFDAALVGGKPQKRYAAALGLPEHKIFTGYDAVDNDYFAQKATQIRSREEEIRSQYDLPSHYFLSLGRFVAKKNLATLIRAYHQFLYSHPARPTHLVMVGSGEEEANLRDLCEELRLPVYQKASSGASKPAQGAGASDSEKMPGVHFYGFRQIEENPIFYTLSEAFILPSRHEEWGLVVNEAMACGLPVIVSQTAGCAEDLLTPGQSEVGLGDEVARDIERLRLAGQMRANGIAFDPNSVDELSRALLLLEAHQDLRSTMGANSRRIIEEFSCDSFARNALLAVSAATGEKFEPRAEITPRLLQAESN